MKHVIILIILFCCVITVFAETDIKANANFPQGIFKKKRNGDIIQYSTKGKKIGIYKVSNGKYVKIK